MTIWEFLKQPVVIQTIILIFSTFLLLKLRLNYHKEKDKNQATKEDIGDITKIVESVKTDLLYKTEELKAELSLTNQHKLNWKASERDAIINYNKEITAWIYAITRIDFAFYDIDNYKKLLEIEPNLKQLVYKVDLADGNLSIFMLDPNISNIKGNLTKNIDELMAFALRFIGELVYVWRTNEIAGRSYSDPDDYDNYMSSAYHDVEMRIKGFKEVFHKKFMEVHSNHRKLQSAFNERIKALSDTY